MALSPLTKLGLAIARPIAYPLATLRRRTAGATRFIAITGSGGKTSTKHLLGPVLRAQGTLWTPSFLLNGPEAVAKTLLRLPLGVDYCAQELATAKPGMLATSAAMFRPDISVVTRVERDHYSAFRALEATAQEKGTLVEALRPDGVAVLNRDDPYVWAMRERTAARVISYGMLEDADLQGTDIRSSWPDPLAMTVRYRGACLPVTARLVGRHWAVPMLATLAVAAALEIPLEQAAAAFAAVEPAEARLSPTTAGDGVTFLRDDWKAPLWTIPAALEALADARATRKIAVIGTISDYPGSASPRYRAVGRDAAQVADFVFFVGNLAHLGLRKQPKDLAKRMASFETVEALDRHLRSFLEPGDLVLLKGSGRADHLERLALSRSGDVACWEPRCGKYHSCTVCDLRMRPSTSRG